MSGDRAALLRRIAWLEAERDELLRRLRRMTEREAWAWDLARGVMGGGEAGGETEGKDKEEEEGDE